MAITGHQLWEAVEDTLTAPLPGQRRRTDYETVADGPGKYMSGYDESSAATLVGALCEHPSLTSIKLCARSARGYCLGVCARPKPHTDRGKPTHELQGLIWLKLPS